MTETPPTPQHRPLVTFALFAYNQEQYIREAVEGAFAQTYEPLEIILSDDCSNDRTFEIMQEMAAAYDGPHDIRLRKNELNRGLAGHINDLIADATGSILSWAAGDDIAHPNRTAVFVDKLLEDKENIGAHSCVEEIDLKSQQLKIRRHRDAKKDLSLKHVVEQGVSVISQSHAFYKRAFDHFGPLREDVTNEGIVMAFRETALGKVVFVDQPLTQYRVGSGVSTYSGADVVQRKAFEPVKITGWYLNAFRQMSEDSARLRPPLPRKHQKAIARNIRFYTALMEINTGAAYLGPLVKNFVAAPLDRRSLRALTRRFLPTYFYKLLLK